MDKILLFGFGNPGRLDDGLGIILAQKFENLEYPFLQVDYNYQLNAEDALLMKDKDVVIFADATVSEEVEDLRFTKLQSADEVGYSTHAMSPQSILKLCENLYKKIPESYLLEIKGYEYGFEERISDPAQKNLTAAFKFLEKLFENPLTETFSEKVNVVKG